MIDRINVLVVCGRNKKRSRTAEYIFKNDFRFNIKSAGLSVSSDIQVSQNNLTWADIIFVMEDGYKSHIFVKYRHLELPMVSVLHIDDEYEYQDPELIDLLLDRINATLKIEFGI